MIRVNSQSGKGGVAYVLKAEHKLDLPRRRRSSSAGSIQERTDAEGGEMTPGRDLGRSSAREYLDRETPLKLNSVHTSSAAGEKDRLDVNVYVDGELHDARRRGQRPDRGVRRRDQRAARRRRFDVRVLDYAEHALSRRRRRHRGGVRRVRVVGDADPAGASGSTPTSSPPRSRP